MPEAMVILSSGHITDQCNDFHRHPW